MTHPEFNDYQLKLIEEVIGMKDTKGREYANGEDRFGNFNRLSVQLNLSNIQVGWVYLTKHLDSIASYCRTGQTFSNEGIRGRIVDAITYLTLIGGMIEEGLEKEDVKVKECKHKLLNDKNEVVLEAYNGYFKCQLCDSNIHFLYGQIIGISK